jgi:putative phosphoesterase
MTTPLEKTLKREITIEGVAYTLAVSPEGLHLAPKGKRRGVELRWADLVSGEAALAVALNASLENVHRFSSRTSPPRDESVPAREPAPSAVQNSEPARGKARKKVANPARSAERRRMTTTVGVISDTHGLLRPEAVEQLRGSSAIVHAGDVGNPAVLEALAALTPRLVAIRGNVDAAWARDLPDTANFEVAGRRFHVLHDIKSLVADPRERALDVVIAGHSHRPLVESRDGVLYVNPGSAGPRRFKLPVTVARVTIQGSRIQAEIVSLA